MLDPTSLQTQAETLLAVLQDQAAEIGWTPARECVTPGPVAVECDSLFVWSDAITPIRDQAGARCHVVMRARFQYVVAICVGVHAGCDKWEVSSAQMHDTAWGRNRVHPTSVGGRVVRRPLLLCAVR